MQARSQATGEPLSDFAQTKISLITGEARAVDGGARMWDDDDGEDDDGEDDDGKDEDDEEHDVDAGDVPALPCWHADYRPRPEGKVPVPSGSCFSGPGTGPGT